MKARYLRNDFQQKYELIQFALSLSLSLSFLEGRPRSTLAFEFSKALPLFALGKAHFGEALAPLLSHIQAVCPMCSFSTGHMHSFFKKIFKCRYVLKPQKRKILRLFRTTTFLVFLSLFLLKVFWLILPFRPWGEEKRKRCIGWNSHGSKAKKFYGYFVEDS